MTYADVAWSFRALVCLSIGNPPHREVVGMGLGVAVLGVVVAGWVGLEALAHCLAAIASL